MTFYEARDKSDRAARRISFLDRKSGLVTASSILIVLFAGAFIALSHLSSLRSNPAVAHGIAILAGVLAVGLFAAGCYLLLTTTEYQSLQMSLEEAILKDIQALQIWLKETYSVDVSAMNAEHLLAGGSHPTYLGDISVIGSAGSGFVMAVNDEVV